MATVINMTQARIDRAECSEALRDWLTDFRAEMGDQAACDELALMVEYAQFDWEEDHDEAS